MTASTFFLVSTNGTSLKASFHISTPTALQMQIYYHDNLPGDQRLPHNSGKAVEPDALTALGIIARHFDDVRDVDALAAERNYANRDEVDIRPSTFGDAYASKLAAFYEEHLHDDEEIRYILDGEGYFDVRDAGDVWVRCALGKGDLLILPAGIYHRFTPGESDYIKAMRLFKEEPKWVPHARAPEIDASTSRVEYVRSLAAH